MSALRALVAGGIVGGIAWAFKIHQEEQDRLNAVSAPNVVKASVPTQPQANPLNLDVFNSVFDMLNNAGGGNTLGNIFKAPTSKATAQPRLSAGGGVKALLRMIGQHESRNNYNIVYHGSKIKPPKPLVQMTVQEVRNWQDRSVRAGSASSAVGYYQIIRNTMDYLIRQGVIRRNELFDEDCQDRAGVGLLERRGLSKYRAGQMSAEQFAQNLAMEWASFPAIIRDKRGRAAKGQSYYAGDGLNKSLTSKTQVMNAVRSI